MCLSFLQKKINSIYLKNYIFYNTSSSKQFFKSKLEYTVRRTVKNSNLYVYFKNGSRYPKKLTDLSSGGHAKAMFYAHQITVHC